MNSILFSLLAMASAGKAPVAAVPIITAGQGQVEFVPTKYYATNEEAKKIVEAGKRVNEVIHGECFANFMKNRKLIQTEGRTPEQVVKHIQGLSGKVPVVMYYRRFTSAVAYRQPPEITINLNRKYFNTDLATCEWASTMGHESVGHSLGEYTHDFNWNAQRDYSVPYSINKAFEACCK